MKQTEFKKAYKNWLNAFTLLGYEHLKDDLKESLNQFLVQQLYHKIFLDSYERMLNLDSQVPVIKEILME